MIKEFWKERKEEKRKQKELRKQNKKLPKSKEQKAYKVFGILFALFLVFGSIFYTCRGAGNIGDYSWDRLVGISDDMKTKLSEQVDKKTLITNQELSVVDWSACKDKLTNANLDVIKNDAIDSEKLLAKSNKLSEPLSLKDNLLGALVIKIIEQGIHAGDVQLIELLIVQEGMQTYLKTLIYLDLSACVISSSLPTVYVTTTSKIEVLNEKLYCLDTDLRINNLSDKDNSEILEVLNKNSIVGLNHYTNEVVVGALNDFAEGIQATEEIIGLNIKFLPKN